jgi:hypothetical protein
MAPLARALQDQRVRRKLVWLTLIAALLFGIAVAAPPTREETLPQLGTVSA